MRLPGVSTGLIQQQGGRNAKNPLRGTLQWDPDGQPAADGPASEAIADCQLAPIRTCHELSFHQSDPSEGTMASTLARLSSLHSVWMKITHDPNARVNTSTPHADRTSPAAREGAQFWMNHASIDHLGRLEPRSHFFSAGEASFEHSAPRK